MLRCSGLVREAAKTPISNRRRKGAQQLADREKALRVVAAALAHLKDSDDPLFQYRRRQRSLLEAEGALHSAAKILELRLR